MNLILRLFCWARHIYQFPKKCFPKLLHSNLMLYINLFTYQFNRSKQNQEPKARGSRGSWYQVLWCLASLVAEAGRHQLLFRSGVKCHLLVNIECKGTGRKNISNHFFTNDGTWRHYMKLVDQKASQFFSLDLLQWLCDVVTNNKHM